MKYLLLLILIGIFLYIFCTFKKDSSYTKKELIIISILLIITLSTFGYLMIPSKTTDLFAHFMTMDKITAEGFNAITSVDNIFVIKILFFLVSLFKNNHLLPFIAIIITYSIYFMIFINYHKKYEIKKFDSLYLIILLFALCNYYYIATSIKTGIAYSLLALSIYLIENKHNKKGYLLMILSIFCHSSTLILVSLYFVSKLKIFKTKYRFILLFTFLGARLIGSILSIIPISIFKYISDKISLYINRHTFTLNPIVLITEIVFAILLIYRCQLIIKKNKGDISLKNDPISKTITKLKNIIIDKYPLVDKFLNNLRVLIKNIKSFIKVIFDKLEMLLDLVTNKLDNIMNFINKKVNVVFNKFDNMTNISEKVKEMEAVLFNLLLNKTSKSCDKNKLQTKVNLKYIYYIESLVLLGLGTLLISDIILERMLMLVAFFMPILIIYESKERKKLYVLIDLLCSVILIGYFFVRLISHITFM